VKADDWEDCKSGVSSARIAACSRVIEKKERSPKELASAYRFRATTYNAQDEKDKAKADIEEAMRLDPENVAFFRAFMHYFDKDYDASISDFTAALKSDPGNAEILNGRGLVYSNSGDRDRAFADYNEAIRLNPKFAPALSNRGNAYLSKGELDLALADLNEAIRLRPNNPASYFHRASVFEQKGDFDAAISECNSGLQLDAKSAEGYSKRSYMYGRKGDLDRAIADATKAIEINPLLLSAFNTRGITYGSKGEVDKALADFNAAIQINPKVPYLYNNRGNAYAAKGNLDRALVDYDFAIQLNEKSPLFYYNRGKAYEKKTNIDRALTDYRKVLDLPAPSQADTQRQEVVRQRIARLSEAGRSVAAPSNAEVPRFKRVALVIGNSKYEHAGELSNPPNDAKGLAASLKRLGFGHVMELYDLSREQMGRALKEFGDRAERAEWAVVYFAGHGLEMNGVTYIVPTDAELLRDTHVSDETISLTQVQAKVDAASKLGLVILDSCRNNPFLQHMSRSAGATRALGRGLANVEPEGNVLVVYSAKHGTTALDGSSGNSPFAEALLRHIEEPGLEINFLFRKVRDDVRQKTQRQQEPFLYGSFSSEPLYFNEATAK